MARDKTKREERPDKGRVKGSVDAKLLLHDVEETSVDKGEDCVDVEDTSTG